MSPLFVIGIPLALTIIGIALNSFHISELATSERGNGGQCRRRQVASWHCSENFELNGTKPSRKMQRLQDLGRA